MQKDKLFKLFKLHFLAKGIDKSEHLCYYSFNIDITENQQIYYKEDYTWIKTKYLKK